MNYMALKKRCKDKGYTISSLLSEIGISKSNATNWKKGGNPSYDTLIKMAEILDCTVDYLLGTDMNEKMYCGISIDMLAGDEDVKVNTIITRKEYALIVAYRNDKEAQKYVDLILKI